MKQGPWGPNCSRAVRSRRSPAATRLGAILLAGLGLTLLAGAVQTAFAQPTEPEKTPELFVGCTSRAPGVYSCTRLYARVSDEQGTPERQLAELVAFWTQKSRDPVISDQKITIRLAGKRRRAVRVTQVFKAGGTDVHLLTAIPMNGGARVMHCGAKGARPEDEARCRKMFEYFATKGIPKVPPP